MTKVVWWPSLVSALSSSIILQSVFLTRESVWSLRSLDDCNACTLLAVRAVIWTTASSLLARRCWSMRIASTLSCSTAMLCTCVTRPWTCLAYLKFLAAYRGTVSGTHAVSGAVPWGPGYSGSQAQSLEMEVAIG